MTFKNLNLSVLLSFCLLACKTSQQHIASAISKDPSILQEVTIRLDTLITRPAVNFVADIPKHISDTSFTTPTGISLRVTSDATGTRITGDCPPDTLRIEKVTKVPQIKYLPCTDCEKRLVWWRIMGIVGMMIGVAGLIRKGG